MTFGAYTLLAHTVTFRAYTVVKACDEASDVGKHFQYMFDCLQVVVYLGWWKFPHYPHRERSSVLPLLGEMTWALVAGLQGRGFLVAGQWQVEAWAVVAVAITSIRIGEKIITSGRAGSDSTAQKCQFEESWGVEGFLEIFQERGGVDGRFYSMNVEGFFFTKWLGEREVDRTFYFDEMKGFFSN